MGDFRKLIAWQKGRALTSALHAAFRGRRSADFPGLRGQILRAAEAVPSNLAEGCAKRSRRELARFAEMAYSSAKEVESHLITARDTEILPLPTFEALAKRADEVARICYGLTRLPPEPPEDRPPAPP